MKYKLINKQTSESHLCDKVTIDKFDYYVSDEIPEEDDIATIPGYASLVVVGSIDNMPYSEPHRNWQGLFCDTCFDVEAISKFRKVIATNNPNIDCSKVVDEVEKVGSLAIQNSKKFSNSSETDYTIGFIHGYNKSQETHPFSEEDMIEFVNWVAINYVPTTASKELKYWQKDTYQNKEYFYSTKELLQLWKEQQPKIVYYE